MGAKTASEDAQRLQEESVQMRDEIAKSKEEGMEVDAELAKLNKQVEELQEQLKQAQLEADLEKSKADISEDGTSALGSQERESMDIFSLGKPSAQPSAQRTGGRQQVKHAQTMQVPGRPAQKGST